jgi:hypothetical protein
MSGRTCDLMPNSCYGEPNSAESAPGQKQRSGSQKKRADLQFLESVHAAANDARSANTFASCQANGEARALRPAINERHMRRLRLELVFSEPPRADRAPGRAEEFLAHRG